MKVFTELSEHPHSRIALTGFLRVTSQLVSSYACKLCNLLDFKPRPAAIFQTAIESRPRHAKLLCQHFPRVPFAEQPSA